MRIKFNVSDVLPQLQQVASVCNQKNTIRVLENIYCSVSQGDNPHLYFTASDNETWLTLKAPILEYSGDDSVPFLMDAKLFLATLRNIAGKEVTLEVDTAHKLIKGTYDNGQFELPFLEASEYPSCAAKDEEARFIISPQKVVDAIAKTEFASSTDALRPVFCGVNFVFDKETLTTAATDTHKLVKYSTKINGVESDNPISFTLPQKASKVLQGVLKQAQEQEDILISYNSHHITAQGKTFKLVARTINGKYPNYNAIFPKDNTLCPTVLKNVLIDAISHVLVFSSTIGLVVLHFTDNNNVVVSAENLDFSMGAKESVSCKYDGDDVKVGIKGEDLINLLKAIPCDEVTFNIKDNTTAIILNPATPIDGCEYTQLCMPMIFENV